MDNRATQETFLSLKEIKFCHFYIHFFQAIFILLSRKKKVPWVALLHDTI